MRGIGMTNGIDRRTIITGLGVAGTALAATAARAKAPAIGRNLPDIVVVGAGAFGGWAALVLRERGATVTLVDLYGPGNARASSGDESRLIRASYGDREIYSRMAVRASALWHLRQEEFGRRLIFLNGSLRQMKDKDIAPQRAVFDRLGLGYELLGPDEVRHRWPQVDYDDSPHIFYEQKSGIVKARESMIAVAEAFQRKGGRLVIGLAEPGDASSGKLDTVRVDGEALAAGRFLFAAGPWLPKLMPQLLGDRIKVPRREMYYVGSPAKDRRYRWEHCPNLTDSESYTAADVDYGIKVAARTPDIAIDPDSGDRMPSPFMADQVKHYVAKRLPGLAGQPIVAARVCQVEFTDNEHYLVDTHPDFANALVAGGGSGHAFKMGPVLGEYLADRLLGLPTDPLAADLFALKAHGPVRI
jgi:sarcosine oxidase